MVYNAMKLFMEVNPQLFDECSHEYTEQQNNAEAIKANRQAKWDRLAQLAASMQAANGHAGSAPAVRPPGAGGYHASAKSADASAAESMDRLRLQDERRADPRNPHAVR